ncbi:MAG: right-handed parallel beta-helix repeat-containing protein [Iphinoe sp. HA4291-MV1]|nr:right-handed parallel beta-helix repeat-containing protein [Iphinoe sp. HA4291-MV1]
MSSQKFNDANPVIQRCKIHNGKASGVLVSENGQGTVEDCDIFSNAYSGVEIRKGGNPIIRQCKINQNKENAVYIHDKGAGTIENCDLTGNVRSAFNIDNPVLSLSENKN